MNLNLGTKHQGVELYKRDINHDPGMSLTYFMEMSTLVAYAFECGKWVQCHLTGKTCLEYANELMFMKIFWPLRVVCPCSRDIYMYTFP